MINEIFGEYKKYIVRLSSQQSSFQTYIAVLLDGYGGKGQCWLHVRLPAGCSLPYMLVSCH